jgi:hypothetical protein
VDSTQAKGRGHRASRLEACAASVPQQRDEERRADERHDRTHRQLARRRNRSGHQVARRQQGPSKHRGCRRDDAVIASPEQQSHRVRRNQPDETHGAGTDDGH